MKVVGWVAIAVGASFAVAGGWLLAVSLGFLSIPKDWSSETHSSLIVAGATLLLAGATFMLVGFGLFAWIANSELATATKDAAEQAKKSVQQEELSIKQAELQTAATTRLAEQGEEERKARRATLDLVFDETNPALWWEERRWVRVMVTNAGPAPAINVVTVLERIDPGYANPLLGSPPGSDAPGLNVLPSRLVRKAQGYLPLRCDINLNDREYFDVLTFIRNEKNAFVGFQIAEQAELASHHRLPVDRMLFQIQWQQEYQLLIRVTANNAEPVERVFKVQAVDTPGQYFRFWRD
jgi:hypothetical protein